MRSQVGLLRIASSYDKSAIRSGSTSRKVKVWWNLLFFLGVGNHLFALDPNQPLAQLYHTSWSEKDGLNGAVAALAQTRDGYLWVGTADGLYRFDGLRFERYKPDMGSIPPGTVRSLTAVADGGLWIGYQLGGVTHLKDGIATNYSESDGLPISQVRSIVQDQDGAIWAAVIGGFARLEGKRWHVVRADWNYPGKSAWALLVDHQGTLWVASGDRIVFLLKGQRKFQDTGLKTTGRVWAFAEGPDGTIWFSDDDRNASRAVSSPLNRQDTGVTQIGVIGRSFLFDRDGAMWFAGDGVSRVPYPARLHGSVSASDSGVETLAENQGLTGDAGYAVLEDREGNIWVGTGGGLDRFRHRNLSWYPAQTESFHFSPVTGEHGDIWSVEKMGEHLVRVQDVKEVYKFPQDISGAFRDPDGTIWFTGATRSWRWEGGIFRENRPPDHVTRAGLGSETKDRSGTVWVSIGGIGEFQLQNGVWKFIKILEDHPDYTAVAAYTDAANRVWLAYPEVIAMMDEGRVKIFPAKENLSPEHVTIITGRGEQIWLGGESGLFFFQGNRFRAVLGADGNGFGLITGIIATDGDGLWLAARPGIVHIFKGEVEQVLRHPDYKVNYEVFDLVSDLPAPLQRSGSISASVAEGSDGLLWFATRKGFARIDPTRIYRNPFPPPVAIRTVVADEKTYSTFAKMTLPPLTKNLRIDYTALSLSIPERVRFRYRLEGSDEDWQNVGTRRQAFYRDLPPGRYSFHVIACNNDGVWNERGALADFTILPAWYQTRWFWLLCLGIFVLAIWIAHQLRMRRIAQVLTARFDERLQERTRVAGELHDTLLQTIHGSKMVADHVLAVPADADHLRQAMERVSMWLGQAASDGRAALSSLRMSTIQSNDLAESLQRVTKDFLVHGTMRTSFSLTGEPQEMHPIVRDEIYRIGYEAIRNADSHSEAALLQLELIYGRDLTMRIRDNGVGIAESVTNKGKEGHFGLHGMRERADRIGAALTIVSTIGSGTEVTLVVPGGIAFRTSRPTGLSKLKGFFKKIGGTTLDDDSGRH